MYEAGESRLAGEERDGEDGPGELLLGKGGTGLSGFGGLGLDFESPDFVLDRFYTKELALVPCCL